MVACDAINTRVPALGPGAVIEGEELRVQAAGIAAGGEPERVRPAPAPRAERNVAMPSTRFSVRRPSAS